MTDPMLPLVVEEIEKRFTLHRLWEIADRDEFLRTVGPRVRGVAAGVLVPVDAALIDALPALEIVAKFGVGYESVDAVHAATRGVVVTNTPDVLTEEVADTALGLLLMTVRRLGAAERFVRRGDWGKAKFPLSPTLRGRTLGILGLGRIGKAIATRAEAFGLEIAYHGRHRQADVAYRYYDSLHAMARDVDILMVVVPGGPETEKLIDAHILKALGPDGVLINIGRGSTVDEAALIAALEARTILAAGLDVFENEPHVPEALIANDDVVLLPHVGSASQHTRDAMGRLVVNNLVSWFSEGRPLTPVPETPFPRG
ncbi:2-hydroxyacid dehydrogenase [Segnochrobactrum spirostomi]|uniref:2-hydroxyacid dehydrogenase n=1 Tax=Segnochrobactrum spirostomi TaxID=2608987 RepID=A0A6A7Y2N7_9HYPH|nr:2-hydroxyacid dehydrogenase [Segnochrobactrum spirostomi]MQT13354.1 2-hydroxyacid dehydrogenase [Segnochrobactrum spirostomi]